jgi:type IV secretory pathway VirD2 relaxase
MATTAIWDVNDRLDRVIDYATNPNKTENLDFYDTVFQGLSNVLEYTQDDIKTEKQFYVTAINCDPATACEQMLRTKLQFQKQDGILAFHGYQAFAPGEATPETAHEIGVRLARELWGDRFEVVVSTHLDKHHLHKSFCLELRILHGRQALLRQQRHLCPHAKGFDRLCREIFAFVIENPKTRKSRHYANGKPNRK